jgi:hypothetical protein
VAAGLRVTVRMVCAAAGTPGNEVRGLGVEMRQLVAVGGSRWLSHEEPGDAGDENGKDARKNWPMQVEGRPSAVVKVAVRLERIAREDGHPGVPQRLQVGAAEAPTLEAAEEPTSLYPG